MLTSLLYSSVSNKLPGSSEILLNNAQIINVHLSSSPKTLWLLQAILSSLELRVMKELLSQEIDFGLPISKLYQPLNGISFKQMMTISKAYAKQDAKQLKVT